MLKIRLLFTVVFTANMLFAQVGAKWDLRKCVDYAMNHNISVKQADVDARLSILVSRQSQLSQIPSANFNLNHGFSYGRTLNRNTNVYQDINAMFENPALQFQANIFSWGSVRNNIEGNQLTAEADKRSVDKIRNDIGLNVARQFLVSLLTYEQSKVNSIQLEQSKAQLRNTRKLVNAGTLPELNAAELEAQVSRDSATYIQTLAQYEIEKLTLKALLNLPADEDFDIAIPQVESIPVDNILEIAAEEVFHMAMNSQPQVQINNLRLAASEKFYKAAKARLYPTISAFGQIGTTFNQNSKLITLSGTTETAIGYLKDPFTPVYALTPTYSSVERGFSGMWNDYGKQLKNNLGRSFGVVISVPLFNGYQAKTNLERARLDISRRQLTLTRDTLQLKQDVYNAYQQAFSAYQTYMARKKQVETAQRSFDLASKRYEVGVMQTIEWLTNQNNYTRAMIDKLVSQYDYVFKMKVLEFYKGQGLRL